MDNLALNLINEVTGQGEQDGFTVNSDKAAEWAVKKIAEEKKELQRTTMLIDSMIAEYQFKKQQAEEQFDKNTSWLKNQLQQYFETIETKKTKTQATYKLPSATLKKKFGGQDFKRDEESLLSWLKSNNRNELVKVKESPDWATLKKEITVVNGNVVTTDGEIVGGVSIIDKPDTFEIEI